MKYMFIIVITLYGSAYAQLSLKDGEAWAKEHKLTLSANYEVDMGIAGHAAPIIATRDGGLAIIGDYKEVNTQGVKIVMLDDKGNIIFTHFFKQFIVNSPRFVFFLFLTLLFLSFILFSVQQFSSHLNLMLAALCIISIASASSADNHIEGLILSNFLHFQYITKILMDFLAIDTSITMFFKLTLLLQLDSNGLANRFHSTLKFKSNIYFYLILNNNLTNYFDSIYNDEID